MARRWWPKLRAGGLCSGDDYGDASEAAYINPTVRRNTDVSTNAGEFWKMPAANQWGVIRAVQEFAMRVGAVLHVGYLHGRYTPDNILTRQRMRMSRTRPMSLHAGHPWPRLAARVTRLCSFPGVTAEGGSMIAMRRATLGLLGTSSSPTPHYVQHIIRGGNVRRGSIAKLSSAWLAGDARDAARRTTQK